MGCLPSKYLLFYLVQKTTLGLLKEITKDKYKYVIYWVVSSTIVSISSVF